MFLTTQVEIRLKFQPDFKLKSGWNFNLISSCNLKSTWNFKLISNWHQCEITVCEFICIENIKITLNTHCFANLKTPWNFKLISSCSLQLEITLNFQVDFKIVYACIFMQCSIKMYMYTHDYIHIYEWIFNSTIKKLTI